VNDGCAAEHDVHVRELVKPDGRALTLYSRRRIPPIEHVPSPSHVPLRARSHLRWHPFRGEWVAYASHRQQRTFLPPPDANPLRPSADAQARSELPAGDYDVAVFDNLFPTLGADPGEPPTVDVPTAPGAGRCEVVVFTQDPDTSLGRLPLEHIALLLAAWGDRTRRHAASGTLRWSMPFENRGAEVGVTLHHPHGQIYAYPFVPPVAARMHALEAEYHAATGRTRLGDALAAEAADGRRLLYDGVDAVAFVPAWARYPYETWVAPRRPVRWLWELDASERLDLARALKTVLLKYDGLWQRPFPYLMVWYQAAFGAGEHAGSHLHAELLPPYRARDRLKYLAGTELGAGLFAMDVLPEDTARELQGVVVDVER
jgi:UDPglucose--hexose-1-phosphate uridylyltransferase